MLHILIEAAVCENVWCILSLPFWSLVILIVVICLLNAFVVPLCCLEEYNSIILIIDWRNLEFIGTWCEILERWVFVLTTSCGKKKKKDHKCSIFAFGRLNLKDRFTSVVVSLLITCDLRVLFLRREII